MDSQQDSPDGSDSVTLYDGQGFPIVVDKATNGDSVDRQYDDQGFLIRPKGTSDAQGSTTPLAQDAVSSGTSDAEAAAASASTGPAISRSTSNPENAASRQKGFGTTVGVILGLLGGLILM